MKFYIPNHLRKLKIIDQVARVIEAYVPDEDIDSFDDYRWYLQNDPVKRFLGIEIKEPVKDDEETDEEYLGRLTDYATKLNYFTKLFYSVKGTKKVIEYAKKFLPHLKTAEITYSVDELNVKIIDALSEVSSDDEYFQCLERFFNALLIFEKFDCNINRLEKNFNDEMILAVGIGVQSFNINRAAIISVDENTNLEKLLENNLGKDTCLELGERILYRDGRWNALCLPITVENIDQTLLSGATIKLVQEARLDTQDPTKLNITLGNDTNIDAGSLYLIKWDSGDNMVAPSFSGVIGKITPTKVVSTIIQGTFSNCNNGLFLDSPNSSNIFGAYFDGETMPQTAVIDSVEYSIENGVLTEIT